ncbi:MAG: PaaI family thioesterase [bacterium]
MCCEKLPYFPKCFVCGQDNPIGMKMIFEYDAKSDSVRSSVTFSDDHVGYENIVHGGLVTMVMDEAMAWMSIKKTGLMCLTSTLDVKFSRAVKSGIEYKVEAKTTGINDERILMTASVCDSDGQICAESRGNFVIMKGRRSSMMKEKMKTH